MEKPSSIEWHDEVASSAVAKEEEHLVMNGAMSLLAPRPHTCKVGQNKSAPEKLRSIFEAFKRMIASSLMVGIVRIIVM